MPDVAVCGAGVIGLTTAVRLQQLGADVVIATRELPTETTSAVAAAIWYPYLAEPRDAVLRWSAGTYRKLRELADQPETGVHMQRVSETRAHADADPWWARAAGDVERVPGTESPNAAHAVLRTTVPVCDTRRYLPWLHDEFLRGGGKIIELDLRSLDLAFELADCVVNCTGLGAATLCDDPQIQSVRGQVVIVESEAVEEALIDDTEGTPVYVVPRGDDCVLGGTAQPDDTRLAIDDHDTARILADCQARVPALVGAPVLEVRVGLRPWRRTVRLQVEARRDGQILVHNYGHGGSGFTLSWGCADEAAEQV